MTIRPLIAAPTAAMLSLMLLGGRPAWSAEPVHDPEITFMDQQPPDARLTSGEQPRLALRPPQLEITFDDQLPVEAAESDDERPEPLPPTAAIDRAAETISEIPFDKVFADDPLLERARRQSVATPSRPPAYRDPHSGVPTSVEFQWVPSNLAHRTLYFDDEPLERFGATCSPLLQPALSAGEFAKDVLAAPVRGIFDPPGKCHYVTGRARVGDYGCPIKERLVPRR